MQFTENIITRLNQEKKALNFGRVIAQLYDKINGLKLKR